MAMADESDTDMGGVCLTQLARVLGVAPSTVWRWRQRGLTREQRNRLERARLTVARQSRPPEPGPALVAYRAVLVAVAAEFSCEPAEVLAYDPGSRANGSPKFRRAARVRRVAQFLLRYALDIAPVEIARATGVSRQAVHALILDVEDERASDPDFAALIDGLCERFAPAAVRQAHGAQ